MARVLVIDDDQLIRDMLRRLLETNGYHADTAIDGNMAMQFLRSGSYDVVITDIFMPDKNGLDVIQEIRHAWPKVKIIALSGGGGLEKVSVLEYAECIGADLYIEKPVNVEDLVTEVRNLLASINST